MARAWAVALGAAALVAVPAAAIGFAGPAGTPAHPSRGGATIPPEPPPQAAAIANGVLTWTIRTGAPDTEPTTRRALVAGEPCLTLTRDGVDEARLCLDGARWAVVHHAGAPDTRIPVDLAAAESDFRVMVRQADLMLPAGQFTATTDCGPGACEPDAAELTVPTLQIASCTAQAPWLVRSAPNDVGNAVALTFDDGPGALTDAVLDLLADEGVPATFFQVGSSVPGNDAIEHRILRAGHVLANHTWSHPVMQGGYVAEITNTQDAIRTASGFTPCLFRAPYGINPPEVVALAADHGLVTVNWNVDSRDWAGVDAATMLTTILGQTQPGSIALFHDGNDNTAMLTALRQYIDILRERGYRFLTVPELLRLPVQYR